MALVMKISQYLLGVMFLVFGLNGFFGFFPTPPPAEQVAPFMKGLASAGYFFPFVKMVEVVTGAALLAGVFVPLALLILAPVVVNIVMLHLMLDPSGGAIGYFALILLVLTMFRYKPQFDGVLKMKADVKP